MRQLRGRDFEKLIALYQDCLIQCWGEAAVRRLESDHAALRRAYLNEASDKRYFDALSDSTSFEQAWAVVKDRFPDLQSFAGALATLFPNTSSVESDFSILGWEKDAVSQ